METQNQEKRKIIALTSEEFAIILRALGIAENAFNAIRKNYIETTVRVRGTSGDEIIETEQIFDKENKIGDLLADLLSGRKDYII
jgi:hypothetical protein